MQLTPCYRPRVHIFICSCAAAASEPFFFLILLLLLSPSAAFTADVVVFPLCFAFLSPPGPPWDAAADDSSRYGFRCLRRAGSSSDAALCFLLALLSPLGAAAAAALFSALLRDIFSCSSTIFCKISSSLTSLVRPRRIVPTGRGSDAWPTLFITRRARGVTGATCFGGTRSATEGCGRTPRLRGEEPPPPWLDVGRPATAAAAPRAVVAAAAGFLASKAALEAALLERRVDVEVDLLREDREDGDLDAERLDELLLLPLLLLWLRRSAVGAAAAAAATGAATTTFPFPSSGLELPLLVEM